METKSFLIGCVAGLIAIGGAQAADLPVKAKPAEYVKICNMYGVGYYYIPGSDVCLKIGGYVRAQAEVNSFFGVPNGVTYNAFLPKTVGFPISTNGLLNNRATNSFNFAGRGVIDVDARSQSEYGAIRGYIRIGGQSFDGNTAASSFYVSRAFIQFAGFTAGIAQSFFDIFSNTELFSYSDAMTSGDTYNYGVNMLAYTAMLGNGFSATVSAEVPRYQAGVANGANADFATNAVTTTSTAGLNMPDFVGNLRLDQNWGYVGISGAVHRVAGLYYSTAPTPANGGLATHPDDKYGWAAGVGGLVNLPWDTTIGASFVGTKGAIGYVTKAGNWQMSNGNSMGIGWVADGLYDANNTFAGGNTQIHLTNAWSANAGVEHMWTPQLRTSLYGGYTRVWYDADTVKLINTHLPGASGSIQCGVPVAGSVWPPINVVAGGVGNSCSPDFSFYQIGSRTQWNVTKNLYMGVDVTYTHLNTAYQGVVAPPPASPVASFDDQHQVSGIFRVQYNLAPDDPPPGTRWR